MSIWYKKTLGLLGLGLATTMVSSSVVSCGVASFDIILNKVVSTDKYYINYTLNVSSWNTAHSMQGEDSRIWSNSYDTFLSTDQYGRIFGSLAISEFGEESSGTNGKALTVGKSENDSKKWTYALRQMNWVDNSGNIVYEDADVVSGVKNAAKYALNPKNNSDVSELWVSFIKGAQEVQKLYGDGKTKEAEALIENPNEFGIYSGQDWQGHKTIVFELTKSASYFESLLTYSVFSPIPDTYKTEVNNYKNALFNGAYYAAKADPNSEIVLKKNKHYALKDSANIEELHFNYLDGGSAAKERTLFESGSSSWFELKSDDLKGWNKYIGKGEEKYERPNFGSAYETESPDKAGSFLVFYNYYNSNIDNGLLSQSERENALTGSKLLQSSAARAYISTTLDRSEMARYFSKTIDEPNQNSKMLRNTYTGVGVAADENVVDYTKYIAAQYESNIKKVSTPSSNDLTALDDGKDPFKNNSEKLVGKTQEQLRDETVKFIKDNNLKTQKVKGYDGQRVILKLILSPSNNTSMNPYINLMMKKFNSISDNPLYIETKTLSSTDEYKTEGSKGATDLFMSGWSPDYKDPSSFLETITLTGPYRGYNGTSRLFELKNKSAEQKNSVIGNNYKLKNENLYTTETKGLLKAFEDYSEGYKEVDTTKNVATERYEGFAKLEYNFFYKNFLALPLYTKAMPKVWTVSHLTPYKKSYEAFGTSQYKLYNVTMDAKLRSREEYLELLKKYKEEKAIISSDWSKGRIGAHWAKQTDIDGKEINKNYN
ncbi:ABC transporter substrate-binding protein [Spiroplasma floricola]|uniref:Oligopeptide ABC transporter substrate-binding protein n=1 Tax=Spiroplasma floricola 23-6 TaxID=1336749 RepID=A0A2K8SGD0_9MOLU|nr:ABC transporter substrate-binding protein [Spiroplasma floricola]AUB31870.1 oligopeptide ABC transporter substrate-binding protein [Spiroplasma floricola 23-6]